MAHVVIKDPYGCGSMAFLLPARASLRRSAVTALSCTGQDRKRNTTHCEGQEGHKRQRSTSRTATSTGGTKVGAAISTVRSTGRSPRDELVVFGLGNGET